MSKKTKMTPKMSPKKMSADMKAKKSKKMLSKAAEGFVGGSQRSA